MVVEGDVDVNGDGDEKRDLGYAMILEPSRAVAWHRIVGAPLNIAEVPCVAVAVHDNVAVDDNGRGASACELLVLA